MSTLRQSIQKLRSLAPELNEAANEAVKIVQEVENLLTKELSLGIKAEVEVSVIQISENKCEFTSLAHCRVNDKFRIAVVVERRIEVMDDRGYKDYRWKTISETPWAECPRDVKLETFQKLPELLEKLVEEAKKAQHNVSETQKTLREIIGPEKWEEAPVGKTLLHHDGTAWRVPRS
jgi:hypothetical protein